MQLTTSLDRCYVRVVYEQLLNEPGAERAYAALRPDIDRPLFYRFEKMWDAYGIRIQPGDAVWHVRVLTGWGDCIGGGCTYHHTWEFTYDRATGKIEKVVDSGPPVPAQVKK